MSASNPTTTEDRLHIGYLHIGRDRSGVRRYGRLVAEEAVARGDLDVTQSDAGGRDASWSRLRSAAAALSDVDIAHVQWKLADWDPRVGGIPRMEVALRELPRPLVLTLHDIFERQGVVERSLSPGALGLRRLGRVAARLVVHSQEERRRLEGVVPASKVTVIPHFVESRPHSPDRAEARSDLDLAERRVITLLGAMTKRRGHRLVLEALAQLPDDVTALFVGAPIEGRDHIEAGLRSDAETLGVADRVRFLGYVDDEVLGHVLAATDIGLCPFSEMSASGALATWISTGRPLVASDLPAIREIDALEPGAIGRFSPYAAGPLAVAIDVALERATAAADPLVAGLSERLTSARVMDRYVALYRDVFAGR